MDDHAPFPPPTFDELWKAGGPSHSTFDPDALRSVPEPVRRYLTHAIDSGTPLATSVRLEMRGEIRLNSWMPFRATQVITPARGMTWRARVGRFPKRFSGFDTVLEGRGGMCWKLWSLLPVMGAFDENIDKASVARLQAELIWVPSALLPSAKVAWSVDDRGRPQAALTHFGETTRVRYALADDGRLEGIDLERWHDTQDGAFAYRPYGARILAQTTVEGYTIPSEVRVAWAYAADDAFESEEYFRATLTSVAFRT